jgi:hypothetical protein
MKTLGISVGVLVILYLGFGYFLWSNQVPAGIADGPGFGCTTSSSSYVRVLLNMPAHFFAGGSLMQIKCYRSSTNDGV